MQARMHIPHVIDLSFIRFESHTCTHTYIISRSNFPKLPLSFTYRRTNKSHTSVCRGGGVVHTRAPQAEAQLDANNTLRGCNSAIKTCMRWLTDSVRRGQGGSSSNTDLASVGGSVLTQPIHLCMTAGCCLPGWWISLQRGWQWRDSGPPEKFSLGALK